ncbi:MAG: hypothetical protein E7014_02055 [Alphaproteobacteria bacterium]|nr:hypothetical protein [Alphaproteobacteria bacterium]
MQSKINEIGRSMVEMLGVLAVIGILSVGGIMGYKFAMLKYRVNETVNELNIRTNEIYQYFSVQENENLPTQTVGAEIKMSLGETMRTGYPISAFVSANNESFFELELQQVETEMCQQLMQIYKVPDVIFVNEQQYLNDLSLCGNKDFVKLNFIYNKTFNKKTACDNRSEFDSISLKCRCKGDSYLDIVSNTCKCAGGEIWSSSEQKCIVSVCEEGYFETQQDGCQPCNGSETYLISKNQEQYCNACSPETKRVVYKYASGLLYCAVKCPQDMFWDGNRRKCQLCTFSDFGGSYDEISKAECLACSSTSRELFRKTECRLSDWCPSSERKFFGVDEQSTNMRSYFKCMSCDTIKQLLLQGDSKAIAACNACVDENNQSNRQVINDYCVKKTCSDGEFMGADGICYSCSDERSVAVLPQQEEACTSSACQRRVVNGYCQIQDCPSETHIRLSNGDCYSCSEERGFISTEEECDKCGNKRGYVIAHNGQIGYCRINNCAKGSSYPYNLPDNLNSCISCQKPWYTGETAYSMEYCEACGDGYYVSGNVCYGPDFCQTGSQLISNSGTECIDCTVVEKIYVGMHEKHRTYSDNCVTVNRFIVEDYSYRCDTRENIPVFLEADKKSCINCRIRSVVDDVCVLTQ